MAKLIAKQADSNLTEAEAIRQAKDGDAAAFEYLYKANCRRAYSVCLRMIKNPAEAEDLTQGEDESHVAGQFRYSHAERWT